MIDDLVLEIIPGGALSPSQQAEIIDLCSRAYEEDFGTLFKTFHNATHILARRQGGLAGGQGASASGQVGPAGGMGVLVSHALWVTRRLQAGNLPPLHTAYIEAVATEGAFRGRGYATAVMQLAAQQIRDYDLGGLSPAETSLYARLGWEFWRGPLSIRTPQGLLPTPEERVMVLRLPNTPSGLDLEAPLSAEWRQGELW